MKLIGLLLMTIILGRGTPQSISLSYNRPTRQSGTHDTSALAVDGDLKTCTRIHTSPSNAWWNVMLDGIQAILGVTIYYDPKAHGANIMSNFSVYVSNDQKNFRQQLCNSFGKMTSAHEEGYINLMCIDHVVGKYLTISNNGVPKKQLFFCEVMVFPREDDRGCTGGEMKCEPKSVCIPKEQICDRVKQCPDSSDEMHCACLPYQYKCKNGPCIHKDWLCDGTKDCPQGDDETLLSCRSCGKNEHKCYTTNMCVDKVKKCDGVNDCLDYSDELKCLQWNEVGNIKPLRATFKGESNFYICSDIWTNALSFQACEYMGSNYNPYVKTQYLQLNQSTEAKKTNYKYSPYKAGKMLIVKANATFSSDAPVMSQFVKRSYCYSKKLVHLNCSAIPENACGIRGLPGKHHSTERQYIINGDQAMAGAWPWHAQLIINGITTCGASIIANSWILTAAHCLSKLIHTSKIKIKVGTNIRNDGKAKIHSVETVIVHPDFKSKPLNNDIALIKLSSPLLYNSVTRPICLPESNLSVKKLMSYRFCVVSGFGILDRNLDRPSESLYLQQGRMSIMPFDKCLSNLEHIGSRSSLFYKKQITKLDKLCAGSPPTVFGVTPCKGDSGGPLVCKNEYETWTQVGVISSYYAHHSTDIKHCTNAIMTKVGRYLEFIHSNIYS